MPAKMLFLFFLVISLGCGDSGGGGGGQNSNIPGLFCNGQNIQINDLECNSNSITVSGMEPISSFTIEVNGSHTWVEDLEIYLMNNLGEEEIVFDGAFEPGIDFNGFIATFTLVQPIDPNGTWTLDVCDIFLEDEGFVDDWCLFFDLAP